MISSIPVLFFAPGAEYRHEGFSEVSDKPVNGKIEGGVYHLQQLDTGHRVQIPYRSDALSNINDYQLDKVLKGPPVMLHNRES